MSDSESDASDDGPQAYRMPKPSDRAKQPDVILALRSSVQCFIEANNSTFPNPQGREIVRYCDYAARYIAPIWHNSVRQLLSDECTENGIEKRAALQYKNRVTGYLRTFLPTNACQNLPKPMGLYFSCFRQAEGDERGLSFPGPVGAFLNDHLVPFIRHRAKVELDPPDLRKSYMQLRLSELMAQDDFDMDAVPECLRQQLVADDSGMALDDDDAQCGMAAGAGSGGEKRQRRRIAKGKCIMTLHNNRVVYDWSCIMSFNENHIRCYLMTSHNVSILMIFII
jgi:hypothetical protein